MSGKNEDNGFLSELIHSVWEDVVQVCNTALHHSEIFGFQLMSLPEPNIASLYKSLNFSAIPILEKLLTDYDFDHDDGRKLLNIKHYVGLLKDISYSIESEDEDEFNKAVAALKKQSYI